MKIISSSFIFRISSRLFTPASPSTFIPTKVFWLELVVWVLELLIEYLPALVKGEKPLFPIGGYLLNSIIFSTSAAFSTFGI